MIQFGDAEDPLAIPFQYAALYAADCDHPCPPGMNRWPKDHTRWITFHDDENASIIDYEPGTAAFANPKLVGDWLYKRYHASLTRPAWIYSDLSNARTASVAAEDRPFYWWVATLDGVQRSVQELEQLLIHWDVSPALVYGHVAAQQWKETSSIHGAYDASLCFNRWL